MEYGFHDLPEYPMISRGEYFLKYLLVMLLMDFSVFFFVVKIPCSADSFKTLFDPNSHAKNALWKKLI